MNQSQNVAMMTQYTVVSTTVYQKKINSNQWPHFVLALACKVEQENNPSDQFSVSLPEIS